MKGMPGNLLNQWQIAADSNGHAIVLTSEQSHEETAEEKPSKTVTHIILRGSI